MTWGPQGMHAMMHGLFAGMLAGTAVGMVGYILFFVFACILLFSAIWLIPLIFYLITMQSALQAVQPDRRSLTPGLVWLNLIPIFNLVWNFFIVSHVSHSLRREFASRGVTNVGDCGYGLGIAMSVLVVCTVVPFLGWISWIASVVLWILFWVKVADLKNQLLLGTAGGAGGPTAPLSPGALTAGL
ncbi:MAG: hypothetical protein ACYCS1_09185 [Gammaproteobacteria bacterium]